MLNIISKNELSDAVGYPDAPLGIPWVRTLAFVVAWGGILCIAWQVQA